MSVKELVEFVTVNQTEGPSDGVVELLDKGDIGAVEEVVLNPAKITIGDCDGINKLVVASNGERLIGYLYVDGQRQPGSIGSVKWEMKPGHLDRLAVECSLLPNKSSHNYDATERLANSLVVGDEHADKFDAKEVKIVTDCFGRGSVVIDGELVKDSICQLCVESGAGDEFANQVTMHIVKKREPNSTTSPNEWEEYLELTGRQLVTRATK